MSIMRNSMHSICSRLFELAFCMDGLILCKDAITVTRITKRINQEIGLYQSTVLILLKLNLYHFKSRFKLRYKFVSFGIITKKITKTTQLKNQQVTENTTLDNVYSIQKNQETKKQRNKNKTQQNNQNKFHFISHINRLYTLIKRQIGRMDICFTYVQYQQKHTLFL